MSLTLVPIDPALLALVQGTLGTGGGLQPFARDILLVDCEVAGTAYRNLEAVEPGLTPGEAVLLQREPENPHDPMAIRIHDSRGNLLGYVPRTKNEVLAHLMDAGKLIVGRLESKQGRGRWLRLNVVLLLRDQ